MARALETRQKTDSILIVHALIFWVVGILAVVVGILIAVTILDEARSTGASRAEVVGSGTFLMGLWFLWVARRRT